jgi:hypothetical protein
VRAGGESSYAVRGRGLAANPREVGRVEGMKVLFVLPSTQTTISTATDLASKVNAPYSGYYRTNGDIIVKHPLKTVALSFGIAVLFGSVPIAFAQSSDTTSNTTTTTSAPAPVVYAAPVVVAPPPPPAVVVAPPPIAPVTTTNEHSSSTSPSGDTTSEHSSTTSNY